ncbi:hypothetical protein DNG35_06870 [Mesonia sp. K7]|nr:hypothetical protein DNG35_06870 [Mesonia sp. K7]
MTTYAQQGFGVNIPSKASAVEIKSSDRGLLIPRVALLSLTSFSPITGEPSTDVAKTNSLLVYNTADVDTAIFPGYYYWTTDGTTGKWNRLVTAEEIEISLTANNGLTKNGDNIQLGGTLLDDTVIDLDVHNLALENLPTGTATDNMVVADPTTGDLKQVKQAPRTFYMPSVIFNTTTTGTGLQRNLYQEYVDQFQGNALNIAHGQGGYSMPYNGGLVGSAGAPAQIDVYAATELYYYITYYDETVFDNLSISASGVLTYDIIGTATDTSYMVIVFVVKE